MNKPFKAISIRDLVASKKPGLARFIPGFIYRWVSKILHIQEINDVLTTRNDLTGIEFSKYVVEKEVKARTEVTGINNIPENGGAILVSNHPLGGLEGMVLINVAAQRRSDIFVIVNSLLAEIPNFGEMFIPVNKLGKTNKASLQRVEETYSRGGLVIVFPAGLCSRKNKGIIRDVPWQKSFISRAVKYQLPVIPVFFSGKNTNRFYRLANIRKFLGLRTNIEMFLLVDELYRQKGKEFKITIGKPIPHSVFDQRKSAQDWALKVQDYVYELERNPGAAFMHS